MVEDNPALLPPSARRSLQQSLVKCQSCLRLTEYLEKLGQPDHETRDRADHLARTIQAALELDRAAQRGE